MTPSISDQLREAISNSPLPRYEIARLANISTAQLSYFMNRKRSIFIDTADRIAAVLGLRVLEKAERDREMQAAVDAALQAFEDRPKKDRKAREATATGRRNAIREKKGKAKRRVTSREIAELHKRIDELTRALGAVTEGKGAGDA